MRKILFYAVAFIIQLNLIQVSSNKPKPRMSNGRNAVHNQFPWMVFIVHKPTSNFICSGSIIRINWVLTSATCLMDEEKSDLEHNKVVYYKPDDLKVVAGTKNVTGRTESIFETDVCFVKAQECFDRIEKKVFRPDSDLGLLQTEKKFDFKDAFVKPLALTEHEYKENTKCQVMGWHFQNDFDVPVSPLQYVDVYIKNLKECNKKVNQSFSFVWRYKNTICAGVNTTEVVTGGPSSSNAGSPLVCEREKLVGVISGKVACADDPEPAVYANVHSHYKWIKKVIESGGCIIWNGGESNRQWSNHGNTGLPSSLIISFLLCVCMFKV